MVDLASIGIGFNMGSFGVIINVVLVLLLIGLVGFAWWWNKKYNYTVFILTRASQLLGVDRGGVIKKKSGHQYFHIRKAKHEMALPDYDYTLFTKKKKYVFIYKVSENTYFFMNPKVISDVGNTVDLKKPENLFQMVPTASRNMLIQSLRRSREKYAQPTFWEKYGIGVMTGTIIIGAIIMIWIIAGMMSDTMDKLPGLIKAGVEAGKTTIQSKGVVY